MSPISEVIEEVVEVGVTPPPTVVGVSTVGAAISVSSTAGAAVSASSSDGNQVTLEVDATPGPRTSVDTPSQVIVQASGTLPGPPGEGGSSDVVIFTRIAEIALSAHRVVTPLSDGRVTYASNDDIADATKPLWLTLDAALAGDEVNLLAFGLVIEGSWSWTPGAPIFLGRNGVLTQTSPSFGAGDSFMVQVASPDTATDVFYNPRTPIAFV